MPYKTRLSTKAKIKRVGYVIFFGLIVVVLGTIVFLIIEPGGGPRSPARADRFDLTPAQREALLEESRELESRFNDLLAEVDEPGEAEIAVLREAYEKHRQVTANNPNASFADQQRLDRLLEYLVEYEGDFLAGRVAELREAAAAERQSGSYFEAVALLEDALEIQERINRELRQSRHSSLSLASSMSRDIVNWRAEPIVTRSREAESEARVAVREERWADALDLFREARDSQVRINTDYQRTPFTDRVRVGRLEEEIASIETLGARSEIDALEAEARALLEDGSFEEAADRFGLAVERQTDLNRRFPGSRYASTAAVRDLEGGRQTALSGMVVDELNATVDEMSRHFRERRPNDAVRRLAEADELVRRLESEFPLSGFRDEELALRISYLNSIRDRIPAIYDDVYENLLPIPGDTAALLYRYETPQRLFSWIMNRNPSRNTGPDLPVDSVNRTEAEEFCRRLSWVLGQSVRLPTRDEFLAAAGELSDAAIAETAWHLRNSEGESRPVGVRDSNSHGFHDLLGNVAEWTATGQGDRQAVVAGGSYDDDLDGAAEIPLRTVDANQRSRTIGFRFVVEE